MYTRVARRPKKKVGSLKCGVEGTKAWESVGKDPLLRRK